jgi:hypothetical protein
MKSYETGTSPQLSKKEFHNVLDKILLNESKPEYKISELEFEFDLKWVDLKQLLDKYCNYIQKGEFIVLQEIKEIKESSEHIEELINFFYKQKRFAKQTYGQVTLKQEAFKVMNPKLKKAIEYGIEKGIIIYTENNIDGTFTLALHAMSRGYIKPK